MNENPKEATLLDFLIILTKWKKFIITFCFIAALVTSIIVLVIPKWWASSATIMLPSEDKGFGALALAGINLSSLGFGGDTEALAQKYIAILNSRKLADTTIKKFNLQELYEIEIYEYVLEEFKNNTSFKDNGDGTIGITAVFKEDSLKAAEMANFMVNQLDIINKKLATEKARNYRIFIENQFNQQWEKLTLAEDSLKFFQEKTGLLEVESQVKESIEKTLDLHIEKLQIEIQYNLLKKELGSSHGQVLALQSQINELQKQISKIEKGESEIEFILPSSEIPDLGLTYYRLRREVELQGKIIEFLLPQVEQAKFQEAKDTPTLQVLDEAVPNELRARPKRTITVLLFTVLAFVLSIIYIAIMENYNRLAQKSPESYEKVNEVIKNLGLEKFADKLPKNPS